ncbi:MAG: PEP-CTERM sorting domain-containing protein [Pirellulales bacterium]|nr:PEP-CTERM sorting domain-containing protein [Pirellulales bacterium]
MFARFGLSIAAAALVATSAVGQTAIVNESFDQYSNTADMQAVWKADLGQGNQPQPGPYGILVPDTGSGLTAPYDNPPGLQGKGVNMLANINEYDGPNAGMMANLVPTATQSIRLSVDIFDNNETRRATVGLRNDTVQRAFGVYGTNFVEIGFYNTRDLSPVDGTTTLNFTGYSYRLNTLFNTDSLVDSGLVQQPNWQSFDLDPILDRPDDDNEFTTQGDIGAGWHRFTVEIGTTYHKYTLDLFRDGLHNTEATEGVGTPGVDAEVTWLVKPHNDATEPNPFDPYTSLRFGSPSGIGNTVEAVVDNILLELVNVSLPLDDADFDDDGQVDGDDLAAWNSDFGALSQSTADANGDDMTNGTDFLLWQQQFTGAPAIASVPEPASALLMAALALGGAAIARRRA